MGRFKPIPEQPYMRVSSVLWPTQQHIIASQLDTVITNSEGDAVTVAEHGRAFPKSRINNM